MNTKKARSPAGEILTLLGWKARNQEKKREEQRGRAVYADEEMRVNWSFTHRKTIGQSNVNNLNLYLRRTELRNFWTRQKKNVYFTRN